MSNFDSYFQAGIDFVIKKEIKNMFVGVVK